MYPHLWKASAAISSVKTATLPTSPSEVTLAGVIRSQRSRHRVRRTRNLQLKNAEAFSAKGDLGSLAWHSKEGKARIVGQLHSGSNKGGATTNHVTYLAPGWYFLDQVRKKFKHADFYRLAW